MKKVFLIIILIGIGYGIFHYYFRSIEGNNLIIEEYKQSKEYINDLYYSDEYFKKNLLNEEDYYIYESIINNNIEGIRNPKIKCYDNCIDKMYKVIDANIFRTSRIFKF